MPQISAWTAVLGRRDERAPRTGVMVFPLDKRIAGRPAVVGLEVAVTASLVDLLPLPPTAVIVVPPEVDFAAVVDDVGRVAVGGLGLGLDEAEDPLLTVSVAAPHPVNPDRPAELCLYNLHVDALPEALMESAAAALRGNLFSINGNRVLLLQRFTPAKASAVVAVSPDPRRPVRISGHWGVAEDELPADVFEVAEDGVRESLADKPTAHVTANGGGTRTVDLSGSCRSHSSLSRETVLDLASRAREAATAAHRPLCLDVAMFERDPLVLRCRPYAVRPDGSPTAR